MEAPVEWWRTFFSGPVVDSWLKTPTAEQTQREADFIQEAIQVPPPAKLLDVPCGGGRHCFDLAGRGYDMTGVDLSAGFLDAARSRSAERPAAIAWEQREMRDLPWPERFDGAYSFGNSFGYLDDEGNADFLKAVARALRPGARFVLDTGYVAEALLPGLQERGWYQVGDTLMLAHRRYDHVEGRLHVEYIWVCDGKVDRRPMSARISSYREIFRLLGEAGFTDLQGYSSLTREPFKMGSGRLLVIAEKKRT
jgi:SAM-dependent methyltransferase